jgi:hypothetical protein
MGRVTLFAALLVAGAAHAGCQGGEGQGCKSSGPLGPSYCDDDLICNTVAGYVCQRPKSLHENETCDGNALCADGLWCDTVESKCRPFLAPGAACLNPFSCGPDAACQHDLVTLRTVCVPLSDGGIADGAADGPARR